MPPPPSCTESLDPRFDDLVLFNAQLEELAAGFRWLEGPVWFADHGCLLFNDIPGDRTLRWCPATGVSVFRQPSGFANGQTRDRQGRLIRCHHRSRCLTRLEPDGGVTTLVSHAEGRRLNSPNDVVVRSDGSIWFSDPLYGIVNDYEGGRQISEQPPALYRFDPESEELLRMASDFDGPNGLAFSPDERRLYVAETGLPGARDPQRSIRVFDVADDGRSLSGGGIFHVVTPGWADGFRVDELGNLWSSAADGVHCIAPDGTLLGRVRVPQRVANLCFGDRGRSRLFICASTSLYALYTGTRGVQWP